jgi:hypothetical protein
MTSERWAQRIVQIHLGKSVWVHDDGTAPGMYDLRIGSLEMPDVAIEVIGAVDPASTETWNIGPAKGPISVSVDGDWMVEISAACRIKDLRTNLSVLLKELERREVQLVHVDSHLQHRDSELFATLSSIGITYIACYRMRGTGTVHLTMAGGGGAVDDKGSEVPNWVGDFLRNAAQRDVLAKLGRSGASGRHAFVIATAGGTPWPVVSYFFGELQFLPDRSPDLPDPVTAVWIVPDFGRRGLFWDGSRWEVLETHEEGVTRTY